MISSTAMRSDLDALWQLLGGGQGADGKVGADGAEFLELLQGMLEAGAMPEEVAAMLQAAGQGTSGAAAPERLSEGQGGGLAAAQRGAQGQDALKQMRALLAGQQATTSPETLQVLPAGGTEAMRQGQLNPLQAALAQQQTGVGQPAAAQPLPAAEPSTHEGLWAQLRAFGQGAPGAIASDGAVASDSLRAEALTEFAGRSRALDEQAVTNLQARLAQLQGQTQSLLQAHVQAQSQAQAQAAGEAASAKAEAPLVQAAEPQAQLNPANARPAVPGPVPTYTLPTPAGQPGWGQAMGERLSWLVRNGVQQAQIRLDPPSLGPVQIAILLKDDQTNVQINAQTAQAREALESELPRLRQMLEEGGFAGVDVGVSQRQAGDGGNGRDLFAALLNGEGDEEVEEQTVELEPLRERGLVDQYA